ncbi:hypothetical protein D7V67_16040 [Clostridium paraputrificum]|uniref:hypothetical protein n=1 Tax=Clostridium paraputrificum TaxID=29363 RepID=UPI000EA26C6C|nr:hypothetical protein [Clostridium paraputrificum]RKI45523.1 hypothetical protein D7V67_16040 [Clostridium paraputrificum]
MSEIDKILLTFILTTFANFLAFLASKVYYKPIEKYRDLKSHTSYALTYYANIYSNPIDIAKTNNNLPEEYKVASSELRKLAAEWKSFIYLKSFPGLFVLSNKKILQVSKNLIGLSNSLTLPYNTNDNFSEKVENINRIINEIRSTLKLKS